MVQATALTLGLTITLLMGEKKAMSFAQAVPPLSRLRLSANHRFFVTEEGAPFFWLGDTAWGIRKLTPAEVDLYLSTRAKQGFTVIQIAPGSTSGISGPDFAGHQPFVEGNADTPNEAFWRNIDSIVDKAQAHGLRVAIFPLWGKDYAEVIDGDAAQAERLGRWLGARYRDRPHVLWAVSGEYDSINNFRLPISEAQRSVINAAARGLAEGHGHTQLMTIHPCRAYTSSCDFHQESWLDFNMLQSGHEIDREAYAHAEVHRLIEHDYHLAPVKPVLDGEPFYEDTPDGVWEKQSLAGPRGGAEAVRRKAYWAVFAGACGHTYGHNDIYGFFVPDHPGHVVPLPEGPGQRGHWKEALAAPGGAQMKHLRALMESVPFTRGLPDQSLLLSPPGTGLHHRRATRADDGSYALVYLPAGGTVTLDPGKLSASRVQASWFDPRTGARTEAGVFSAAPPLTLAAPGPEELGNDWVLVLTRRE